MANEIDGEIYARNNAHTTCRPMRWQLNPTTGANEEVPITGLTDLRAYLSASAAPRATPPARCTRRSCTS